MSSLPENKHSSRIPNHTVGDAGSSRKGGARRCGRLICPMLCLTLCLLLGACGYGLDSRQETVLGPSTVTMKMKGVEHPTLYPWMGQIVRSSLRDELGARKVAVWVDDGPSDYSIQVNILSFTIRSRLETSQDTTILYTGNIRMQAIVYRGSDNSEAWRSAIESYSDTYESYSDRSAAEQLSLQAIRHLVAQMRRAF
ncbi:MAG: LPS assembly lipoprotein LptE [Deltaproteobacteria bacterium]|jgi:hypothetical protein|nr:LPS assembly lipoprotein LptE [Deltaproteobacteria bacterium]